MRKLRSALALALVLPLLAGCEATGGNSPHASVHRRADPAPLPPPSAIRRAVLARAPTDPVAALPERIAPPPLRGTWTSEFAARLYQVNRSAEDDIDEFLKPTLPVYSLQMPMQFAMLGLERELAALEQEFVDPPDESRKEETRKKRELPISSWCEEYDPGCALAYSYRHQLAIIKLARGDRRAAEALVAEIDAMRLPEALQASELCNADGLYMCAVQSAGRIAWLFQTGMIDRALQHSDGWAARQEGAPRALLGEVIESEVALMMGQGRLRDAARTIDGLTAMRRLRMMPVDTWLFAIWDGAIARGAAPGVQFALTALADRLPSRYPNADAAWRQSYERALECRAAHAALSGGIDAPGAAAMFDRLWQEYRSLETDRYSTGLCLHALAPRVGRAGEQPAIRQTMQKRRAALIVAGEKTIRANAAIMGRNGMNEVEQSVRVMAASSAAMQVMPGYLLLDEQEFERFLIAYLDDTKKVKDLNLRRHDLSILMRLVMWRILAGGEA